MSQRPGIVPCAIYAPSKCITQPLMEGRNIPGALAKIASKTAERRIDILSGMIVAGPSKGTAIPTLLLDLTDS